MSKGNSKVDCYDTINYNELSEDLARLANIKASIKLNLMRTDITDEASIALCKAAAHINEVLYALNTFDYECRIKSIKELIAVLDSRPDDFTAYDFPIDICLAVVEMQLAKSAYTNATYIKMFNKKFREEAAKYAFDKFLADVSFP